MGIVVEAVGFGLVTASVAAIAAVGFTLQYAISGILNLAYGEVMTASAFVGFAAQVAGAPLALSLLVGALTGAVLSVVINRWVYQPFVRRGTGLFGTIIVTVAVSLILQNVILAVAGTDYRDYEPDEGGLVHIAGMVFTGSQLAIIALAVAVMLVVHALLRLTKFGKSMRATAANPRLARSCGIRTNVVRDVTWLISGAMAGLGGVVLAKSAVTFSFMTGTEFLLIVIAAAILGGVGEIYGAILGALAIGIASELAAALLDPSYKLVVSFAVLILVLLIRPEGILRANSATRKELIA
jgi:branched-chain amino acid transport system permease protein/neutral amino acid transport system permease protein